MVKISFKDKCGRRIRNFDASDDLPDEVASMGIEGPFDKNRSNYRFLKTMLKKSSKKLDEIKIKELSAESPEFLAFLVLLCNKTHSLYLEDCELSTNGCTCLMAALLSWDGIRHLSFLSEEWPLSANQAKILLEGVASSPCLESFALKVSIFANSRDVGRYLTQALRQNQSLKQIYLDTNPFPENEFQNIMKASILSPTVKTLSIEDDYDRDVMLDVMQDALCRKDCTLEELHLTGVALSTEDDELDCLDGSIMQNMSVTSLKLHRTFSNNDHIMGLVGLFKSLVELNLSENYITQLYFLDPFLFGENSQLRSLDVSDNNVDKGEMILFIKKLPKLRGLKHLAIGKNSCERSKSVNAALTDALRHNTDLEHVDFDRKDLPLDLNRGGRRMFESPQRFPTNLLPLVLERASKISYFKSSDSWGSPTNEKARTDVVFWMLQRIVPQL